MILSKEFLNSKECQDIILSADIDEGLLTENIPPDLASAYRNASYLGNPERSHDKAIIQRDVQPRHGELGRVGEGARRFVKWDYGKANYEPITADEAVEYLGLRPLEDGRWKCNDKDSFASKLQNLRFIYDGKLMEWEARRGGQSIAALYSVYIPYNVLRRNDIDLRDSQGNQVEDTKYVKQYKDFVNIIHLCEKIYKTDEYEHPLSPETLASREYKKYTETVRRMMNTSDPNYHPHRKGDAFGGREDEHEIPETGEVVPAKDNTFVRYNITDTGSHNIHKRFTDVEDTSLITYNSALADKKSAFKVYDDIRSYVKKLNSDLTEYTEEDSEYAKIKEKIAKWEDKKKKAYEKYLDACKHVNNCKVKVLTTIDSGTAEFNARMANFYDELQRLEVEYNEVKQKIAGLAATRDANVSIGSSATYDYISASEFRIMCSDIGTLIKNFKAELENTSAAQTDAEDNAEDVASLLSRENEVESKVIELLGNWSANRNHKTKAHLKKLEELKARLQTLSQEVDDLLYTRTRRKKEKQAAFNNNNSTKGVELDPTLKGIVQFVTDTDEV